jgi:malonyl CoA-acyl carrier protein transacylase
MRQNLKLLINTKKTKKRTKKNRALTYNINFFSSTMRKIYVVITHNMRMKIINVINQQKIINYIVKQNYNLRKNMNIMKIAWIKKIKKTKKKYAFFIIEFVNAKLTNRLIKNDLLNDYFHRVCEYFEKECKLKQCFRC